MLLTDSPALLFISAQNYALRQSERDAYASEVASLDSGLSDRPREGALIDIASISIFFNQKV